MRPNYLFHTLQNLTSDNKPFTNALPLQAILINDESVGEQEDGGERNGMNGTRDDKLQVHWKYVIGSRDNRCLLCSIHGGSVQSAVIYSLLLITIRAICIECGA